MNGVEKVAAAIPAGEPGDMIDLNRKIIARHVAEVVHAHCLARCAEIRSRIGMGDSDATAARFEMRALVAWQLAEDFKPKGGV